ncbi:MAG: hypothetical protein IJ244_06305 [Bacteroidaceae bacterium]|nr:hypothetical protein [Bacteroidaceae bacterium]
MAKLKLNLVDKFVGTRLTNGEFLAMQNSVLKAVINSDASAESMGIVGNVNEIKNLVSKLQKTINMQRASALTPQVEAADKARDRYVGFLFKMAYHASKLPATSALYADAQTLYAGMRAYKGVGDHSLSDATSEINGLLAWAQGEKMKDVVTKFALTTVLAELKSANAVVQDYLHNRELEKAALSKSVEASTGKQIRSELENVYVDMVVHINASAVNNVEGVSDLVYNLNSIVQHYRSIAAQAATRTASEGTVPEEAPQEETPADVVSSDPAPEEQDAAAGD